MSVSGAMSRSTKVKLQFGGVAQRPRSLCGKKPPEPLRRAIADCLSPSPSAFPGNSTFTLCEPTRTLRDYLASTLTVDMAYSTLLEHALEERDRSQAIVSRCVALLKRFLLRYIPGEQTLLQIDLFCATLISEYDSITNRRVCPSSTQQSVALVTSSSPVHSSLPASSVACGILVKSLNYVRTLVAQHLPKRPLQSAAFSASFTVSKQSLPSLSSLLSKSFNSQLNPVPLNIRESTERNDATKSSARNLLGLERIDVEEGRRYIAVDVFKWRWSVNRKQLSSISMESDGAVKPRDAGVHGFLEVGAAALLLGHMKAKVKGQTLHNTGTTKDSSDVDKLLQQAAVTATSNFSLDHFHLRQITTSKRMKSSPGQVWDDVPVSTFHPHVRRLFQYRHYSEQQPLRLNPAEVQEVIAAVCSDTSSTKKNLTYIASKLTNHSGRPSIDVAVSVLIKLVIDMYVMDSEAAAPLTLFMLEEMLKSPTLASRIRAFDLILNLGVHAHLLEPMLPDDPPIIEQETSGKLHFSNEEHLKELVKETDESDVQESKSSAIDNFETNEREETMWSSALSCLLYFVCDRGKIWKNRLKGLDIRVLKVLLEMSRQHAWAEAVHSKLICILSNLFYCKFEGSSDSASSVPVFISAQIDLLGGIEFICHEYSRANSREEKRSLFAVLLDYVLHQINEICSDAEGSHSYDEIQQLAEMLTLVNAPEAFYIAVKDGLEGIGEILRGSISSNLSRFPNFENLNTLLEKIMRKLDVTINTFSSLDKELSYMFQLTKSHNFFESIESGILDLDFGTKVKLAWTTLHSLLHSKQSSYRHSGYIWLVELLVSEVGDVGDSSIWSNVSNLRKQIAMVGLYDSSASLSIPLPICIWCGFLKSKYNYVRWGFLFVLEKLLMRLKLLLDENELRHVNDDELKCDSGGSHLEKANALIDIMCSALSLVVQMNETDRINILKMSDMLFSQLCLRVFPATGTPIGDLTSLGSIFDCITNNKDKNKDDLLGNFGSKVCPDCPLICETSSLAALLLRGYAFVPMQLVERVPTSLFYWPLIQLAGEATDNIALGVAVGSKGDGNIPGATPDIRAALLLLLIGKCNDPAAYLEVGQEDFFRGLLDDTDSRVAYYSSAYLLKRLMTDKPEKYQRMLQNLIFKAQQSNNEKLLENPYLQLRGILQLSTDLRLSL